MAQFKLTAQEVKTAKPGRYGDGAGLWLEVSKSGARRWIYRFTRENGKVTEMGLGSISDGVSLARARELAAEARATKSSGKNPIKARKVATAVKRSMPTFGELADTYLATHEKTWSNDKHRSQWRHSLTVHCAAIRDLPINELDVAAVLSVLEPLWSKYPETADRVRNRIGLVWESAKPLKFVSGENPTAWRGNLKHLLPELPPMVRGHHAALDYKLIPQFMAALREVDLISARALEFCILTAVRTGEVIGAEWGELRSDEKIWEIPAERMKMREAHAVPLSDRAVAILDVLKEAEHSDIIFPGPSGNAMSNMAMTLLLRRMQPIFDKIGAKHVTVHGFRSSFRDWAGETTDFPEDLCERALAHRRGDKTQDAYNRLRAVERRRALMQAWADYCCSEIK